MEFFIIFIITTFIIIGPLGDYKLTANVILVPVNVSSHAEVSDFGHASRSFASQQAIPSRDVPERRETEARRSAHTLSALTDKTQHLFKIKIQEQSHTAFWDLHMTGTPLIGCEGQCDGEAGKMKLSLLPHAENLHRMCNIII